MNATHTLPLVSVGATIRETMKVIDSGQAGGAVVVDNAGVFVHMITDGDIRRMLLKGEKLEDKIVEPLNATSAFIMEGDTAENAQKLFDMYDIQQLPILDNNRRPVDILQRKHLSTPVLLSPPHMSGDERSFVDDAFSTNWIAPAGPNLDAFEKEISAYLGVSDAVAVSSGTAAIHLGLRLLDVGPGDIVFTPSFTFIASVSPIVYQHATPVFIDSEPESWNMSPLALERALKEASHTGSMPKAIIVVNIYGQSANYVEILKLADTYGVPVLEDAAESLGATYQNKQSGRFGKIGTFSFNGNKIITTSGGGLLIADDQEYLERARYLATQARQQAAHYEHTEIGYNYRMSNVLAGIGRGQLLVLKDRIERRRAIFEQYQLFLRDIDAITFMPELEEGRGIRWLSTCLIDENKSACSSKEIMKKLASRGIETRSLWKPMHRQPVFSKLKYYPHETGMSVSDDCFEQGLCLPSGTNISDENLNRIQRLVRQAING
jgi:dTDP-4-amino-4,6-dideoxygalactose transaminase